MTRGRYLLVVGALVALVPLPGRATPTGSAPTVRLRHDVIPGISRIHPVRHESPTRIIDVAVTLGRPDRAGEAALARAQADPRSPQYRKFLTPALFDARFGVAPDRTRAVAHWATATGLRVVYVSGARDYLLLSGSVRAVERLFAVHINQYDARGHRYYANAEAPAVPAALDIEGVSGLDDVHHAEVHPHEKPATGQGRAPQQGNCIPGGCTGALDISDLWSAYNMPESNRGSGASIAIFGEGAVDQVVSDLRAFEKAYHLPRVNVREVLVHDDFVDTAGTGEWDLDTQSSTGAAPDVREIVLYFGQSLSYAATNATFNAWADDPNGPLQANASFSGCEPTVAAADPVMTLNSAVGTQTVTDYKAEEQALGKAVLEGRTLFGSSGDQGGSCYYGLPNAFENNGVPLIGTPAADPNAVGVGGTVLYTTGGKNPKRVLERALDASGGGVSQFIPAGPAQQLISSAVVVPPIPHCLVDHDGTPFVPPGPQCRSLPDVVADSGDISVVAGLSGMNIISGGAPTSAAGTSLSSPLMAGMWARVQAASKTPGGLGFAANTFYADAVSSHGVDDFYDITVGGNGQYYAQPRTPANPTGYDYAGGLGVPDVTHFMQSTTGRVTPSRPIIPIAIPDPVTILCHGGDITDPEGDARQVLGLTSLPDQAPSDPHVDIVAADIRFDPPTSTLVFTVKVAGLAAVPPEGEYFRYDFAFAGGSWEMVMSRTIAGTESYSLRDTAALNAPTILSGLTGSFDDATNTVTGQLPLDKFNPAAKPKSPLKSGEQLTGLSVLGQQYSTGVSTPTFSTGITDTVDSADAGGCPFTLLAILHGGGPPVQVAGAGTTKTATRPARLPATGAPANGLLWAGGASLMLAWIARAAVREQRVLIRGAAKRLATVSTGRREGS